MVLCCDMSGARDDVISESSVKMRRIRDSEVLLAGDLNAAKELLIVCEQKIEKYVKGGNDLAINELLESLRSAVTAYRDGINHQYLTRNYGITFGNFLKHGKDYFYEMDHARIWSEIRHLDLRAGLIISSFSDDEAMHITISSDGHVQWVDNYAVQGTGARICNTFLAQRDYDDYMPLDECLYRVLEAKLAAERDPYVGEETVVSVVTPDERYWVDDDYVTRLFDKIDKRKQIPAIHLEERFLKPDNAETT